MTDLHGRTVLITGGNGGIGLGIGRACARAGANIIVWGRNAEKNDAAQADLRSLGVERQIRVPFQPPLRPRLTERPFTWPPHPPTCKSSVTASS